MTSGVARATLVTEPVRPDGTEDGMGANGDAGIVTHRSPAASFGALDAADPVRTPWGVSAIGEPAQAVDPVSFVAPTRMTIRLLDYLKICRPFVGR